MTRNKKWKRWIGLLCFQVERKWVENLHWFGDFSGHAFVDGGYLFRIVRKRNRIAKAKGEVVRVSRKHTARVAPEEAAFRPALPLCPLPGISEMRMSNTRQVEESLFSDDAVVLPHQSEIRAYFNRAGTVTISVDGEGMVAIPCHAVLLLADRLLELAQQDTKFSDDDFSEPNE